MTDFHQVPIPGDTLHLTHGDEVTVSLQSLDPGTDAVAIGFTDPRAGAIRVLIHPQAAQAVADGIQTVLDNADYLRAENHRIQKGTHDE